MAKITDAALKAVIQQLAHMDLKSKESVCDDLFREQPNLLASVLVLSRMSESPQHVEVVLEILITAHLALNEAGVRIATISEDEQDRALQRLTASIKFTEGLAAGLVEQSIKQTVGFREEPWFQAYVFERLQSAAILESADEDSKYLILSALNLVGCIANAKETN